MELCIKRHVPMDVSNCIVYNINDKQKFVFLITLQHIKAIINCDSLVLMDSDHPAIQEFIPELEVRCHGSLSPSYICLSSFHSSVLPPFLSPSSLLPSTLPPPFLSPSFLPSFLNPSSPFTLLFLFQERLKSSIDVTLPFEFRALETMLMKIVSIHFRTSYPGHFLSSHVAWV